MKRFGKKVLAWGLVLGIIVSANGYVKAETEEVFTGGGLIWEDEETLRTYPRNPLLTARALPASVDLTDEFPAPGNQGTQNSCAAWAIGYALKSNQEYIKRGWSKNSDKHVFSPAYIFNQCKSEDASGMTIGAGLNLLESSGVCPMNYFPYVENDCQTQPSELQHGAASLYKAGGSYMVESLEEIKASLASGNGVVMGVAVYPDFIILSDENPIYDSTAGWHKYDHAICLIGYNDEMEAFKFINSAGSNWGLNGYGWISYELVEDPSVNRNGASAGFCIYPAADDYILGDINSDGLVDSEDSLLILKHVANMETLTGRQLAIGDVNGDTVTDAIDSNEILKLISGQITKLPLYQ